MKIYSRLSKRLRVLTVENRMGGKRLGWRVGKNLGSDLDALFLDGNPFGRRVPVFHLFSRCRMERNLGLS